MNDVLERTDTNVDLQKKGQAKMQSMGTYMAGIFLLIGILLVANFGLALSAIEMSKESHVKSGTMNDLDGEVVKVSSSDFTLGSGGEMVQRASTSIGPVGAAPVLSKYKLSSRIPNKYMQELESFTVTQQCSKEFTAAVGGCEEYSRPFYFSVVDV